MSNTLSHKLMALLALAALAAMVVLAGCSCSSTSSSSAASSAASSSSSSASSAASASSSAASAASSEASSPMMGMPNPWTEVATASEAATGAGLDSFIVPGTVKEGSITFTDPVFTYMSDLAQATYEQPVSQLTIRKSAGRSGLDFTGDYNTYAYTWTQNIKGLDVTCSGNTEGVATHIEWSFGGANYYLMSLGLGGDEIGMTADEVATTVSGIN